MTIADAAESYGCRSIAFTYNDPVSVLEYASDIAEVCQERGIKAVAVTAGCVNDQPRRCCGIKWSLFSAGLKDSICRVESL